MSLIFNLKSVMRSFLVIAIAVILSSCGFHLRGSDLAIQKNNLGAITIYLAVNSDDHPLYRQIKNDLLFSRFKVTDDPTLSPYHLVVGKTSIEKKAIGVDSNGRDNEFEINQRAEFIVNNRSELHQATAASDDASEVLGKQQSAIEDDFDSDQMAHDSIVVRRSFYFDGGDSVGKRAEENMLLESMREELSRKIISHFLVTISRNLNRDIPLH